MHGEYNEILIVLSLLIAVATSYTALDLANRGHAATAATGRATWLAGAALSLGGGIWSMHFVAMLADRMPGMQASYEPLLTALSFLLAVSGTGLGFVIVGRLQRQVRALLTSGLLMGIGITSMHYTGMAAMQIPMTVRYDPFWVSVSLFIAIGAATASLWLAFLNQSQIGKSIAAVVMGAAIAGMHFSGMRAASFAPAPTLNWPAGRGVDQETLAMGIAMTTFFILSLALLAAFVDRRLASQSQREAALLRLSEERFRLLYRKTPLPLHAVDSSDRIVDVSDAWLALLGYQREEVLGKSIQSFMTSASAHHRTAVSWPTLLTTEEVNQAQATLVTRAGSAIDVEITGRIERDALGDFRSSIEGLVDVTARNAAEIVLRKAQKMETLGELTGGVAHELNNLLAIILGNLELLQQHGSPDPRASGLINTAVQGVQRGVSLTQQMRAFARRQTLVPKRVDMIALVLDAAERLARPLGSRHRLAFPVDHGTAFASVDEIQLERALGNLIVNARDAMPDGGLITIDVQTVLSETDGAQVAITISDHGTGMDQDTLSRATEPFFSTKGPTHGAGLGLSMVDGFAAQSGGRLHLASIPGEGTRATIYLPAAHAVVSAVQERPAFESPRNRTVAAKVLAVDDDFLVLMNTQAILEDMGHNALTAHNGEEALKILDKTPDIDLVITDYAMPRMTGLQLAVAIHARRPDLPVILATGHSELPTDQPNIVCKLDKPYFQADLEKAMDLALGSKVRFEVAAS